VIAKNAHAVERLNKDNKSLADIRNRWKQKLASECSKDFENDLKALATIPSAFDRSRYTVTASSCLPQSTSSSDAEVEVQMDSLF
jgi:hypothetical protein